MTLLILAGVAAVAVFAMSSGKGNRTLAEWFEIDQANIASLGVGADPRKYAWEASQRELLKHVWSIGKHTFALTSVDAHAGDRFTVTYRVLSLEGLTPQTALTTPVREVGNAVFTVSKDLWSYGVESVTWPPGMVVVDI